MLWGFLYGLHSGIPLCCVWAYLRGLYPSIWPTACRYRPCERCAWEIAAWERRPVRVHRCRPLRRRSCRWFARWDLWRRSDTTWCESCLRRASVQVLALEDGMRVRICLWCDDEVTAFV